MKSLRYLYDYGLELRVVRNVDVVLLLLAGAYVGFIFHVLIS